MLVSKEPLLLRGSLTFPPFSQRSYVKHARGDHFWPAARQFPAQILWEKPLSRKIGERSMKRSWKSVKRNKSRKKENWRLFYHRGYSSTSVLFIYHSVLRFTKKVIRYWNFVVCCSNGRVREFIIFSCSKSSRGSFPYIFSEVLRGGLQKVCLCPSLSSSEHRCR